jgi:hypothetical protein
MILYVLASLLSTQPLQANPATLGSTEHIRIVPVPKTPESNTIVLALAIPKMGEVQKSNPVWLQFRLDGYPLGAGSPSDRVNEVNVSKLGQTLHVTIDDYPYFAIHDSNVDPFNENGYYYDTNYKFEIPYYLNEGIHFIRAFPARSYGESLKNEGAYFASYFYIGKRDDKTNIDLQSPYLTYNEPSDQIRLTADRPVLLDFYISNCELSADGYKVALTIDGTIKRTLTSWQPYYIYGLPKGKHTIRLQLLNGQNNVVKGPFNNVERTIRIQ